MKMQKTRLLWDDQHDENVLGRIASWLNDSWVFCCYFIISNRKFLSFLNGLTMRDNLEQGIEHVNDKKEWED